MQPNLLKGTVDGLTKHKEVSQDHSSPLEISPSWNRTGEPHFTGKENHQILSQKDPLRAVSLLLWLGARRHLCRHRKYYISPAPLHQPRNYPLKLDCHTPAIQGTLRPHLYSSSGTNRKGRKSVQRIGKLAKERI